MMEINLIYITTGSKDEAVMIGKALINDRLAACVNIIDNMHSIYMWDGKLQDDKETILIAKTTKGSRKNNFTFLHLSFSPSLADTSLAKSSK